MNFIPESDDINNYLTSSEYIDFDNKKIRLKADALFFPLSGETDKIRAAFEFVRDQISHSGDIDCEIVTKKASDALKFGTGICLVKSMLLAAFLRYAGIPAGLCYQRLTRGGAPETGYIIHGLNAVYIKNANKWIRLDARGNKPGVNAEFCVEREKIAYPVRHEYDEIDYPAIYAEPHPLVAAVLRNYNNRKRDVYNLDRL